MRIYITLPKTGTGVDVAHAIRPTGLDVIGQVGRVNWGRIKEDGTSMTIYIDGLTQAQVTKIQGILGSVSYADFAACLKNSPGSA